MSDFLYDAQARHQHYLERFKTGEYNKLYPFLKRLEEDLIVRLSKSKTMRSQKRIKALLDQVQADALALLTEWSDQLSLDLEDLAQLEAEFGATTLSKDIGVETRIPASAQVVAAVKARPFNSRLLKDTLKDFPKEQAKYIRNSVAMGFAEGRTNQQIITDVIGSADLKFKDGAMNLTRTAASRLVRTSIQHTAMVAQAEVFEANGDIVEYYMWVSTLDSRTSPTCRKRDGQVYKKGKGALPPAHPNCRSGIVAVTPDEIYTDDDGIKRGEVRTGTRASKGSSGGKQVKASLTYNEWLKQQTKAFQVDALGATRAELFRKGGLSVNQFVDRKDQPLSLSELKATFPAAWAKAKLD